MQEPLVLSCDTSANLAIAAADYLAQAIWAARGRRAVVHPEPVRVAISGGTTPYAMLSLLQKMPLPWSEIHWYWVDERFLETDNPRSNVGAARKALFDHVSSENPHLFAPQTPKDGTLAEAATNYEAILRADLGDEALDVVLLGIGDDGHTASLFPGEPEVSEETRWVVPVPARAGREPRISLTRPVIQAAHTVVLLAQGASKQTAFRAMRAGGDLSETPSRLVHHTRSRTVCLVDAAVLGAPAT